MSVAIIINPVSGGTGLAVARRRAEAALAQLAAAGEKAEAFITERRGHARELATASVHRGARLVFAWGGDGTVNEVGAALAFSDTALAVIPSGSGNGLARALGIAARAERAIADALRARPFHMDVGQLGGRLFVNIAGLGFDAHVASRFDEHAGGRRGFATYASVVGRELLKYRCNEYRLSGDGLELTVRAVLVALANSSQYGNGAVIAPLARIDDGQLDLVTVEERSRLETIWSLPKLFSGAVASVRGVTLRRFQELTIESERPITFHVDGEAVHGDRRLQASVLPGALKVCVRES